MLPWVIAIATGVVLVGGTAVTAGGTSPPSVAARHLTLYNGSTVDLSPNGLGVITGRGGKNPRPFATVLPQGRSALGDRPGPSDSTLLRQFSVPQRTGTTGSVVVALPVPASLYGMAVHLAVRRGLDHGASGARTT